MKTREMERALGAADPVGRGRLDGLDLEAMEADLLADLETDFSTSPSSKRRVRALGARGASCSRSARRARRRPRRRPRPRPEAAPTTPRAPTAPSSSASPSRRRCCCSKAPAGGSRTSPSREKAPTWLAAAGAQGRWNSSPAADPLRKRSRSRPDEHGERDVPPKAVRQRRVELSWHPRQLGRGPRSFARRSKCLYPHGRLCVKLPVAGYTAYIHTQTEYKRHPGWAGRSPDDALWTEGGYTLELRAAVPELAAFEERLGWLSQVDSQTWLDAMPAKVVKAADHDAAVREMLKGIPVPSHLQAVTDPRRRPHHQPLPSGRLRDRHRLLPLVPAVGRGTPRPATARRRPKPKRRWRPPSAGRSCVRWRGRRYPQRSGSSRRRCRAA